MRKGGNDLEINKIIGDKIRKFRQNKNITQEELADFLGVSTQAVSRYELGDRKVDNDILYKLADYFNVSIDNFFPPIETSSEYMISDEMGNQYINNTQLAIMTGLSVNEIKNIVNGENKLPKPSSLIKIGENLQNDEDDENLAYSFLIGAGYVEDPQDEKNELYGTGIRYLLSESERNILCDFLCNLWNADNTKHHFNSDEIYNTLFEEENKKNFSNNDVINIINNNTLEKSGYIDINNVYNNTYNKKLIKLNNHSYSNDNYNKINTYNYLVNNDEASLIAKYNQLKDIDKELINNIINTRINQDK